MPAGIRRAGPGGAPWTRQRRRSWPEVQPESIWLIAAASHQRAHVSAAEVIGRCAGDAATAGARALENHDERARHAMKVTRDILDSMGAEVARGVPEHVFALMDGAADIHAVATVARRGARASEIGGLVEAPAADPHAGAGAELLHRIIAWSAALGRVVTVSPASDEIDEYYGGLGLQLARPFGRSRVSRGYGSEEYKPQLRMVTLEM